VPRDGVLLRDGVETLRLDEEDELRLGVAGAVVRVGVLLRDELLLRDGVETLRLDLDDEEELRLGVDGVIVRVGVLDERLGE
jgi:hypothetical protein